MDNRSAIMPPAFKTAGLITAVLLIIATGWHPYIAIVAGILVQPVLALSIRQFFQPLRKQYLKEEALALLSLWAVGLAITTALLLWPLSSLRQHSSLGGVLGLSIAASILLIAIWRYWPLWRGLEREPVEMRHPWRILMRIEAWSWQGFALALAVAVVLVSWFLLAWPGFFNGHQRLIMAGLCAALWPTAHYVIQSIAAPVLKFLPIIEMDDGQDDDDQTGTDADVDHEQTDIVAEEDSAESAENVETQARPRTGLISADKLYDAARRGRVDQALDFLKQGADPFALPAIEEKDQRSLMALAAVLPDLRLLRALIQDGVDVNQEHHGMTPLLAATRDSWHGRPEAVLTLLSNGADARVVDFEGNTPMHHAARSSDPGVAAVLRDSGASVSDINFDGYTPLGIACLSANWRLARFLLERGAYPEPEDATPALVAAASIDDDDPAGVTLLIKHKSNLDVSGRDGRTALHVAAYAGHVDIVTTLLAAGADALILDAQARSPLLEAARGGQLDTFEALLAARSWLDGQDGRGQDALILACLAEIPSPALIKKLIELGANASHIDVEGKRAVDHAAQAGRWSLVSLIDKDYPIPGAICAEKIEDANGLAVDPELQSATPDKAPLDILRDELSQQRIEGHAKLLELLSKEDLTSLLYDDVICLLPRSVLWLVEQGASLQPRFGHHDNYVFYLLDQGEKTSGVIAALLGKGITPTGAGGMARYLSACLAESQKQATAEEFAMRLLDAGADPFASAISGDTVLTLAARLHWLQLTEKLLQLGVDPNARDQHGMTALHVSAALSHVELSKLLVRYGASAQMRAGDGQTPHGVALATGHRELSDWLDWTQWPLPGRPLRSEDLPAAAIAGDMHAVEKLLKLGFDVDARDAQDCTALIRAAGSGHADVVDVLLNHAADVTLSAKTGATALSAAVSMNRPAIIDKLLAGGASHEQRLPGEVTVLMLASALGLPDICVRLLTAGASISAVDVQGLTPLHCAALYGFTAKDRARLLAVFDTLLLAGAEPDAIASGGVTPLLLLLGARAEPGTDCDEDVVIAALDHLLDEGVSLDAQDPRGFGPLHLAALHGQLKLVQRLLRAGCNPDLRDTLNRTPREIAVMRGFVDVAAEFKPAPSGVSMARFLKE